MKALLLILAIFTFSCQCNQDKKPQEWYEEEVYEEEDRKEDTLPANIPPRFAHLIPERYEILDLDTGFLNRDTFPDYVLVLKLINEKDVENVDEDRGLPIRPVLVVFSKGQELELVGRCDSALYAFYGGGMAGDPFREVVIDTLERGVFLLRQSGGSGRHRWDNFSKFKYNTKTHCFFLKEHHSYGYEDIYDSYIVPINEEKLTPKDFGKIRFEDFSARSFL
jgi:hypothetical protein